MKMRTDINFLVLKIITQTASFRIPEFQNFHKSFVLPPPTTIVGFSGAALGMSPKSVQDFFYSNEIQIGVYGESLGKAKDIWKYNDFKNGSIIKREIYFHNTFFLVFSAESYVLKKLRAGFENPIYALTLGTSDALAKLSFVKTYEEAISDELENCMLEGDVLSEVMGNINNGLEFSIYSTSEPLVYDLPVKFFYESDYGVRMVLKRKKYSFIGKKMKLNVKKKGVLVNNIFIPIFSLK